MKSLVQFIKESMVTERFVNAHSPEEMEQYKDEVWKIVKKAYEYCGGVAGINTVDDLIKKSNMWKMVRRSGRIVAIFMYTYKKAGRKAICCACTPDEEGKAAFKKIMEEDFKIVDREVWCEVSGAAEVTALKQNAMPFPAYIAQLLMPNKEIKVSDDGFHYERKIGGTLHTKLMVGNFKNPSTQISDELRNKLIATAKEIGKKEFSEKK